MGEFGFERTEIGIGVGALEPVHRRPRRERGADRRVEPLANETIGVQQDATSPEMSQRASENERLGAERKEAGGGSAGDIGRDVEDGDLEIAEILGPIGEDRDAGSVAADFRQQRLEAVAQFPPQLRRAPPADVNVDVVARHRGASLRPDSLPVLTGRGRRGLAAPPRPRPTQEILRESPTPSPSPQRRGGENDGALHVPSSGAPPRASTSRTRSTSSASGAAICARWRISR